MTVGGRVLLCSDGLDALGALPPEARARSAVLVPDAAGGLDDGEAIVARDARRLRAGGLDVTVVRAAELGDDLAVGVIVVGGGDPFALLATLRATGADGRITAAVARGAAYVGLSAGAL